MARLFGSGAVRAIGAFVGVWGHMATAAEPSIFDHEIVNCGTKLCVGRGMVEAVSIGETKCDAFYSRACMLTGDFHDVTTTSYRRKFNLS